MIETLNIIISDDIQSKLNHLLEIIHSCSYKTNCITFTSGEQLVAAYQPLKYDLLLTDIYMDGMNGIEAVSKIRKIDKNIPIAFVTSSLDFALESYRLFALKYIEKPYKKEDVEEILRLAMLQKNGKDRRIPFSQILYLEQHSHKLTVHLLDGSSEEFYEKLSNILEQLKDQPFYNCHKSYAVNLNYVQNINSEVRCFVMENNDNVPIRRESFVQAKKTLASFLFKKTRKIA